jgi:hypothetical protein
MKHSLLKLFLGSATLLVISNTYGAPRGAPADPERPNFKQSAAKNAPGLFANYEALSVELSAPVGALFKNKEKGKEQSVAGTLTYSGGDGVKTSVPVEVHLRGFSSLAQCTFPKLELKFKPDTQGLFAGMKSVDLSTHCLEKGNDGGNAFLRAAPLNHREALIYRMAELLDIPTYKVRPALIHYEATGIAEVDGNDKPYQAFFVEDKGAFRKRLNAKEILSVRDPLKKAALIKDPKKASQFAFDTVQKSPQILPDDVVMITLFEYMVSNIDWGIKADDKDQSFHVLIEQDLWNIKIFELPDKKWMVIPHDFNLSGIILGSAREKINKYAYNVAGASVQQKMKQRFLDKKDLLYQAVDGLTEDPEGIQIFKRSLDTFYSSMDSF